MLELLEGKEIKCARITTGTNYYHNDERRTIVLKVGHDKEDYARFLNDLNFEYDDGYGTQKLHGIVWFKDGTWAERREYDGSEWWEERSLPDIPKELLP